MSIQNDTMSKGEKIYFSCLFGLLSILLFGLFYLVLFEFKTITTYKVKMDIFTIDRSFDPHSNQWIVGVKDMDNIRLGAFVCSVEPVNKNPALYYQMTKKETLTSFKYSFYFSYNENCASVSNQRQQSIPNTRLVPQRKKGEFIL